MFKGISFLTLTLILSAAFFSMPADAKNFPTGYYKISLTDSNLVLDLSGNSTKNGNKLLGWTNNSGQNQVWKIVPLGNGTYKILHNNTNKALDMNKGAKNNGAKVMIWDYHGGKNQRWRIIQNGKGYSIVNVESGLALDLKDNKRVKGKEFQGYRPSPLRVQRFNITRLSSPNLRKQQRRLNT